MTRVVGVGDTAGCHVCEGIYAHFRLPNGKLAHFFDKGSELQGTPKPNLRVRVSPNPDPWPPPSCPAVPIIPYRTQPTHLNDCERTISTLVRRSNQPGTSACQSVRKLPDFAKCPALGEAVKTAHLHLHLFKESNKRGAT